MSNITKPTCPICKSEDVTGSATVVWSVTGQTFHTQDGDLWDNMNYCSDCSEQVGEFHYVDVSQDEYLDALESEARDTRKTLKELEDKIIQELNNEQ